MPAISIPAKPGPTGVPIGFQLFCQGGVDAAGRGSRPDTTGIAFDAANVPQRAERPVWAARRVTPCVRQSHIKDALIAYDGEVLDFQMRPYGIVVDF